MKQAKSKQTSRRRKSSMQQPREYRMPHTAAELKINCAECGAPAERFDYQRARQGHRRGFVCAKESRSAQAEKLLVREQPSARSA